MALYKFRRFANLRSKAFSLAMGFFLLVQITAPTAAGYALGSTVADMRQSSRSGRTSCPQYSRFDVSTPGTINRQWSTSIGTGIRTLDQSPTGKIDEIEAIVQQSFAVWTGVSGTLLKPASLGTLQRNASASACSSSDGRNSICFNQNDAGFAIGVLAFTRVVSADTIGAQLSPGTLPSTFVGEILDADVLLRPSDVNTYFATPQALAANPNAYDLESILTHELGHFMGFSHSAVWRAMMFPFSPAPGQFSGIRPTAQSPDAPLSDDDRAGLRVLYPDPGDVTYVGSINGHVLPANALALPTLPAGVTGIFPAQVVAVDAATGIVASATIAGWSCTDPGPAQFDGSYSLQKLAVGPTQTYQIYAEPIDGAVSPGDILDQSVALCRSPTTDVGSPAQFACTVPPAAPPFSARLRPAN